MMDSFITPSLQHSNTSLHLLALTRLYPIAGLLAGYLLVMLANPVRPALRDGFRCIARYERVWLTFALLGFAYFVFQFVTFSSVPSPSEINFAEIIAVANWNWTPLAEHSDLSRFPCQHPGCASETARLLAAAGLELRSSYRASFEDLRLH